MKKKREKREEIRREKMKGKMKEKMKRYKGETMLPLVKRFRTLKTAR